MVFISGIHGVGKTFFCKELQKNSNIECYSASQLIEIGKKQIFSKDKYISDIEDNQKYLLSAVNSLKENNTKFVLDGHFCLLNQNGVITRISEETFIKLQPNYLVVLTEKAQIIHERRLSRDGIEQSLESIKLFQQAEILYAKEISSKYNIPLDISHGKSDIFRVISKIIEGGY